MASITMNFDLLICSSGDGRCTPMRVLEFLRDKYGSGATISTITPDPEKHACKIRLTTNQVGLRTLVDDLITDGFQKGDITIFQNTSGEDCYFELDSPAEAAE